MPRADSRPSFDFLRKAIVKISKTAVTQTASGLEQQIQYQQNGRTRREIFVGRTESELNRHVKERVEEMENQRKMG
jgi:hypothetical protein